MSQELIDIVLSSNDGKTAAAIAGAGGYSVDAAEQALKTLVSEVAGKVAQMIQDPEELELLLDVIEAGEHDDYLTNADAMLSREAIEEGEEILAHVYGSRDAAWQVAAQLRRPSELNKEKMQRAMTLAATLCIAALVKRGRETYMAADLSGIGSTFWGELVKAIIRGITHVPAKRRRRRNRATYARSYKRSRKRKRQRRRSRRKSTPDIADIFGELLKRGLG